MRKIVVTEFMSLDGIMEAPEKWSFPYWNDDIAKFKQEELELSDTLLLGRITYDGFAQAWPGRTDKTGFAERMNNYPKYVVSKSLTKTEWNNTHVLSDNFAQGIAKLKEEDGRDILVFGSGELVNTLLALGLVDQLQLLVYPVILGQGKRLFRSEVANKLELKESKTFRSGVVLLTYTSRLQAE
ncbi:MAG: dihydrofolate reductase family protein [Candidatus Levybacteria bacterium]|nr:dihydrofolate reductase family protein [Candidatus Levybacteria bacterium]